MTQKEILHSYNPVMTVLLKMHASTYMCCHPFVDLLKRQVDYVYNKKAAIKFSVIPDDHVASKEVFLRFSQWLTLTDACRRYSHDAFHLAASIYAEFNGGDKLTNDDAFDRWVDVYSEYVANADAVDDMAQLFSNVRNYNMRVLDRCARRIWMPIISLAVGLCTFLTIFFLRSSEFQFAGFIAIITLLYYVILPNIAAILHVKDLRDLYRDDYRVDNNEGTAAVDHVDYHCPEHHATMRISFSSVDKERLGK